MIIQPIARSIIQPIVRSVIDPLRINSSDSLFAPEEQSASLVLDFVRQLYGVQPAAKAKVETLAR